MHNPDFPSVIFANKEDFPRVSSVIQHKLALLMYHKFADKLNAGGGVAPHTSMAIPMIPVLSGIK